MTTTEFVKFPRLRLSLYLWSAGMLGVVAVTVTVVPQLVANTELPMPLWMVLLVSVVQSALMLAFAVWLGVILAPKVGLRAVVFESMVGRGSVMEALRPQLIPALVTGVLGGAGLYAIGNYISPTALIEVDQQFSVPILARVFYGGITEELLLRWGLMTLLVWTAWRFVQRQSGAPRPTYIWLAIFISALLFGAGHLPAVAAMGEELTIDLVMFIVGGNTVFGMIFGYLYWRYGLEEAMIAHAVAHIVNYTLSFGVA